MCGLVFSINSGVFTQRLEDWFTDSMLASQVRGVDSTGIFLLNSVGQPTVVKGGLNASLFLPQQTTKKVLDGVGLSRIALGHVRAATTGRISAENAHPFRVDREDGTYVIGAHNGTLRTWRAKDDAEKFDVDSEWMIHMLAKHGEDAFRYFNGAFAIVWYDSREPHSLFMARNSERPLHFLVTENARTIVGCSELGMLGWLSTKHGLKAHKDHPIPYYLEEGKIYQFSLDDIGQWETRPFEQYDVTTSYTSTTTTGSRYGRDFDDPWQDWPANQRGYSHVMGYPSSAYNMEDYDEEEQEATLNGVKEALRVARYTLYRDENDTPDIIVDPDETEDLDAALHQAIADLGSPPTFSSPLTAYQNMNDMILSGGVTLHTITPSTATLAEQDDAMTLGAFGQVVRFKGTWYDEDTSEMWGTFDSKENGDVLTYEAVVRMVTQKYAEDVFMNSVNGALCTLVGVQKNVEWFVVEQLTRQQQETVEDMYLCSQHDDYNSMLRSAMH